MRDYAHVGASPTTHPSEPVEVASAMRRHLRRPLVFTAPAQNAGVLIPTPRADTRNRSSWPSPPDADSAWQLKRSSSATSPAPGPTLASTEPHSDRLCPGFLRIGGLATLLDSLSLRLAGSPLPGFTGVDLSIPCQQGYMSKEQLQRAITWWTPLIPQDQPGLAWRTHA
jgi:hypothetical protein